MINLQKTIKDKDDLPKIFYLLEDIEDYEAEYTEYKIYENLDEIKNELIKIDKKFKEKTKDDNNIEWFTYTEESNINDYLNNLNFLLWKYDGNTFEKIKPIPPKDIQQLADELLYR